MTILEACVQVLSAGGQPMTSKQIYEAVVGADLYKFGAKDPQAILRGTLRKHLRSPGPHRVEQTAADTYRAK